MGSNADETMMDIDLNFEKIAEEQRARSRKRKFDIDQIDRDGEDLNTDELAQVCEQNLDPGISDEDEWEDVDVKRQKLSDTKTSAQFLRGFSTQHNVPSSSSSHVPNSSMTSSSESSHKHDTYHLAALEENHASSSKDQEDFLVHEHLPVEFFDFCGSVGRFDVVPGASLPARYLAEAYMAFYLDCGLYVHIPHPQHVCTKSEQELLDEAWVTENVRKGIPLPTPPSVVVPRKQKKPLTASRHIVRLRKHGLRRPVRHNARERNSKTTAGEKEKVSLNAQALVDSIEEMEISRKLRPATSKNARGRNLSEVALEKATNELADTVTNLNISAPVGRKKIKHSWFYQEVQDRQKGKDRALPI